MKKRQITKIAALGLVVAMLTGCGSQAGDSGQTGTVESSAEASGGASAKEDTSSEAASSQASEGGDQEIPTISIGLRAGNSYVQ